MAIEHIKDDLNVNHKSEKAKIQIERHQIDEYDYSNILSLYKSQLEKREKAKDFIDNFEETVKEQRQNMIDNVKNDIENVKQSKEVIDKFFELTKDMFREEIMDPTNPNERTIVVNHDMFDSEKIEDYLLEMYWDYVSRDSNLKKISEVNVDEWVDEQIEPSMRQLEKIRDNYIQDLSEAEENIKIYEPYVQKIADEWGMTIKEIIDQMEAIKQERVEEYLEKEKEKNQ